jgi:hypothetical protein
MHRRQEYQGLDGGQHHRLLSGGLDEVWVRKTPVAESPSEALGVAA